MTGRTAFGLTVPAIVLAAMASAAAARPVRAQEDTTLIDAVVRFDILDGPEDIVAALSYNSTILVPVRRFLAMTEIRMGSMAMGDSLTAIIEPGSTPVTFTPATGRLVRGDSVFTFPVRDARWRGDDLFISTAVLDRAFGVSTVMDWSTLTVSVRRTAALPIVRRARRERRRGLMRPRVPPPPVPVEVQPHATVADGAVLEWSLRGAADRPLDDLSADIGVGAMLLGGSFELRQRTNRTLGVARSDTRVAWEGAWADKKWLQQLGLGDVLSNGRRARLVQGFAVTNAPFIRSSEFDIEAVFGQLPAGWEVELYDRGVLGGFHEADAVDVYRLPLELQYGSNPFDLVFYGPAGEVIREERTIRVPQSRIPAGQLEYAVAAGRCRFEPCKGLLNTDVRYGLNNHVTLQGGLDTFWTEDGDVWQPYASVSATPLPAFHTTGEVVLQGHLRGSVDYEPSTDLRVNATHTIFDDDGTRVTPRSPERHRTDASVFWRPGAGPRSVAFSFSGFVASGSGSHQNSQRLSARWRTGWLQHDTGIRREYMTRNGTTFFNTTALDVGAWANLGELSSVFTQATSRANLSVDLDGRLDGVQASIGRQFSGALRVDLGMSWFRVGGSSLQLRLNTLLRGPRLGSVSSLNGQGGARSATTFDGSMVVNPATRRVQFSDGRDLGRAGLSGVVFLDDNGNGVRDPGEPGLEGVGVDVGGWPVITDAEGRFAAWNIAPFRKSVIEIDTLGLNDPRLVATHSLVAVATAPNSFLSVDLPVVIGAEVAGFVLMDGQTLAGAPVEIRNLRTGATINLMTFADGGFYKVGVGPGDYEVGIPSATLQQLGATSFPLSISVPSGGAADEVQWDDLVIRIQRNPGL